jgi:ABC-2 type transport system permease protein
MLGIISAGSRISVERKIGWTRQLRITPLKTSSYFSAKVVCGYLTALLTMVLLYSAGSAFGVRLTAGEWATMVGLVLVGLIPFALLGIMFGHLLKPDSLGPAVGGLTALFAVFGGAWGPIATGGAFLAVVKFMPSYWLVQSGKVALGGGSWPAQGWLVVIAWSLVVAWLATLAYRRDGARVT